MDNDYDRHKPWFAFTVRISRVTREMTASWNDRDKIARRKPLIVIFKPGVWHTGDSLKSMDQLRESRMRLRWRHVEIYEWKRRVGMRQRMSSYIPIRNYKK